MIIDQQHHDQLLYYSCYFAVRRIPYQNQVFTYIFDRIYFIDALEVCSKIRGKLLFIDSAEIQQAVVSHMRDVIGPLPYDSQWDNPEDVGFWVGGFDLVEGVWRFINGTRLPTGQGTRGYQNWHSEFEGNIEVFGLGAKADFRCMYIRALYNDGNRVIDHNGRWFDGNCWTQKHAICQSDVQGYGKSRLLHKGFADLYRHVIILFKGFADLYRHVLIIISKAKHIMINSRVLVLSSVKLIT